MPGLQRARVGEVSGTHSKFVHLPKAFVDGNDVQKGQSVELVLGDVLVLIPRDSAQARRVRRAMAEEG
jgi:hypothetical protein